LIVNGLQSGLDYRLRYAGRNLVFDSGNMYDCDSLNYSKTVRVLTAVLPSAPYDLKYDSSMRYKDALTFTWKKPVSNGGSPL